MTKKMATENGKNHPLQKPNDFVGNIGQYQVIETQDQSLTLKSLQFNEACHSLAGAYAETLHNYVVPCSIISKAQTQKKLTILEVGFGLGVGVQASFQSLQQSLPIQAAIDYIALELDEALIGFAQEHTQIHAPDFPQLSQLCLQNDLDIKIYQSRQQQHRLSIILGDARQTLRAAFDQGYFEAVDVIYQDAFSPRKNPELWTQEWFETLKAVSSQDVIMSTYCSSVSPRKAMRAAGFKLQNFKGLGKKRECTIASLSLLSDPNIIAQLDNSSAAVLTDSLIDTYRQK